MKIHVKKLGVLEEVEVDLKPMTVFVGPNNSGKTLLAYVLLAIFGEAGFIKYQAKLNRNEVAAVYPPLIETIQQLINEGNSKLDLLQFANDYAQIYFNEVAKDARKWLADFMKVDRFSFEELNITIDLNQEKEQIKKGILSASFKAEMSAGKRREKPLLNANKKMQETVVYFYSSGNVSNLPEEAVEEFVMSSIFRALHRSLYDNTRAFPTERTTLITMFSSAILRMFKNIGNDSNKPKRKTNLIENEDTIDTSIAYVLSGPLSNFLDMMVSSLSERFNKGSDEKRTGERVKRYTKIYNDFSQILQKEILGGNLDLSSVDSLNLSQELLFEPKPGMPLEMNIVSSMVKELAPLVLYLKYIARPGEWLVIDEPEMNLHPEAQVRLTELLAMLVNAKLPLLFTTHSPYMVDHLVNLMKAYEHEDKAQIKDKFYFHQTDTFISKDDVAVYLFEKGSAKNILDEDGIIQWRTFSAVSDQIAQLYFDL